METVIALISSSGISASSNFRYMRNIWDLMMSIASAALHAMKRVCHRLQWVRIEVVAFTLILLLLLVRESLRRLSMPEWSHIKIAAFAMLVGMLVASWKD